VDRNAVKLSMTKRPCIRDYSKDMPQPKRVVVAFLIAPVLPAAVFAADNDPLDWLAIIPIVVSYFHGLLAATGYLWLRNSGKLSTTAMLAVSVIVGLLPAAWLLGGGYVASRLSPNGVSRSDGIIGAVELILKAGGLGLPGGIQWRVIAGKPINRFAPNASP